MRTPTTTVETPACLYCGNPSTITVPEEGYRQYRTGALVQDALYDVPPDTREMLLSGTHPDCWKEIWEALDDE